MSACCFKFSERSLKSSDTDIAERFKKKCMQLLQKNT